MEAMDVDVLIVGGGAAGLCAAIQAQRRFQAIGLSDKMVAVIEKGSEVGAHSLSGAVLNPSALVELFPNYQELGCPIESVVHHDEVHFLTENSNFKLPVVPPSFQNEGNFLISASKFNRWLGQQAEAIGVNIFTGFAAVDAIYDAQGAVVGIRTGDKGRDKDGSPKSNFEEGMQLNAKVTVFAEGTRGSLFRKVAKKLELFKESHTDTYEEGVKEVIQCPAGTVKAGQVIHTAGWPLTRTMGGTFIYTLPDDKIVVGLVGYLDTSDPFFDPHLELQRLKAHPFVRKMIEGGKVIAYGGKTLPTGGWYSRPKLHHPGMLVVGDSAMFVDVKKLKGMHLAMKSGSLAGECAADAVAKNDASDGVLSAYTRAVEASFIKAELWETRNFHHAMSLGFGAAIPLVGLQELTGGRGLFDGVAPHRDSERTESVVEFWGAGARANNIGRNAPKPDGVLFFDKLSSVYLTGTMHDEHSPNHLQVANPDFCRDVCYERYQSPCNHFCPAAVYEMVPESAESTRMKLQVNYTNCIHCKTCDIKCPADNITWTTPEGGGGPQYKEV